nr:ATP-binding protein [Ktedonobacteraceae bacterium]
MSTPIQEPEPRNPYYHTAMVRDPDLFFGRQNTIRRLYASMRDRQCISLVGPRRIGKSSLLGALTSREVLARFGYVLDEQVLAYVDTSAQPLQSYEDLLEYISGQLVAQNQARLSSLRRQPKRDVNQFRQFLEDIKALGLYPILLLDEFESIAGARQFELPFFSFLRSQANVGMISYITASKDSLNKVCHVDLVGSPFFNIFSALKVGALTSDETRELIMVPAEKAGVPFNSAEVAWIVDMAGHHPFFIQRACHFLFEAKSLRLHARLDLQAIEQQVYAELLPHFDYAWSHLGTDLEELLAWEARREGVSRRSVPELSESRLFRRFVCEE